MTKIKRMFIFSVLTNIVLIAIVSLFFVKFNVYNIIANRFIEDENVVTDQNFATQDTLPLSEIYLGRESLYENLSVDSDDIVMVGDSITQRGEWIELTQSVNVKNRGIDSDSVAGVINRLDTITKGQPKSIVLNIGINDLYRDYGMASILKDYQRLVAEIQESSPNTEIYIQSLLPVNNSEYDHPTNNKDIQLLNKELKKIADESNVAFIDAYPQFVNGDNEMKKEYTKDGVHLSGEGFLKLKDILSNYISF